MHARQQASGPEKEPDADSMSSSTDTSRWSTPSRMCCSSEDPRHSFGSGEKTGSPLSWEIKSGQKLSGPKRGLRVQASTRKKTNRPILKLPAVKPVEGSKLRVHSATTNCIRQLRSQVSDLQQQLSEVNNENRLLKTVQHRHTVALQHFQDSEGSISQVIAKHDSEVRALKGLLRGTRMCRDNLARQLQATENKLRHTKANLQHLQVLSQDQRLLERDELTQRLAQTTAELGEKNRRIQDMERNLELCQASFKRQIATEQRKIREARSLSFYLQDHIIHLTRGIQDREKELEKHNIYFHRFLQSSTKKGRENKVIQTDGLERTPSKGSKLLYDLMITYSDNEEGPEQQEISVNWSFNNQEEESMIAENPVSELSAPEEIHQEEIHQEEIHQEEIHQEETETYEGRCVSLGLSELFKENTSESSCTEERSEDTPEHQIEDNCSWNCDCVSNCASNPMEPLEPAGAPQVFQEQEAEHETETTYILEKSLEAMQLETKKYKLPKIRRRYTFKQSIENLHNGKPAYSFAELFPGENTTSTTKMVDLCSDNKDLCLSEGKLRGSGEECSLPEIKEVGRVSVSLR
ncbi:uncharacterized protein ACNS7B_015924 [Menidia menidia]